LAGVEIWNLEDGWKEAGKVNGLFCKVVMKVPVEPEISAIIKFKRLQWVGHVQRMNMERIPKKILYSTIGGRRRAW
jgi:hypothetical protein